MQYAATLLLLSALAVANPLTPRAAAATVTAGPSNSDSFSSMVRADVKSRWPDCGSISDDFSALYCVNTKLSLNAAAASYAASAQARSDYAYLKPFYTMLSVDAAFSSQINSAHDGVAWYSADLAAGSKHTEISGVAFLTSVDKQILSLQTASPGAGSATGASGAVQTGGAGESAGGASTGAAATSGGAAATSGGAAATGGAGASSASGAPSSTTHSGAAAPANTGLGLAAAAVAGFAGLALGL